MSRKPNVPASTGESKKGRNLAYGAGFVAFIAAFGCLIGMRFAARRSQQLTVGLLGAFGVLIGVQTGSEILSLPQPRRRPSSTICTKRGNVA